MGVMMMMVMMVMLVLLLWPWLLDSEVLRIQCFWLGFFFVLFNERICSSG